MSAIDRQMARELIFFGAIGVAGYFFVTRWLPDILKGLGKGAGDTVAGAATGAAQGVGTAAAGLAMATPNAINAFLEGLGFGPDSIARATSALATGWFDLWMPSDAGGPSIYYTAMFTDQGQRHAVPSTAVNSQGQFRFQDKTYQLMTGKDNQRYAAPV